MGTPELAVPSLGALIERFEVVAVATQPDRRAGRGRGLEASPVKRRALEADLPVLQPAGLRDPAAVAQLAAYRPDLVAVVAYGLILPPALLELPPLGCVNVHTSLLPRHRGASPIHGAILAGDEVTGVTTMLMDEGLDTGPILLQEREPVRPRDTTVTLGARLAERGAALLVRTVERLAAASIDPAPQDDAEATLTGLIRKQDGLIDWRRPAVEIERRVRAMQPWPSAFTFHGDTRLQIWRAEPGPDTDAEAGTVVALAEALLVACGDGRALRVHEMQRPGGRRLPTADFVRGYPIEPGDRLAQPNGEPA